MISGPTDRWLRRAATTAAMILVVEECVLSVGGSFSHVMPDGWFLSHVKPFTDAFEALRQSQPLP